MDARFQVCFTPLAGVLFAFPSRYWFAIGHHVVFRLGGWSPRIRTGFHVSRPTWDPGRPRAGFRLWGFHPLWLRFPADPPNLARATARSRNPGMQASRFGLMRFRSPLLTQSRLLSFPRGTEMFHFPRCRPERTILFIRPRRHMTGGGFPHSDIRGSKPADGSPRLFAVCRVLHRLTVPRHPSCARIRLARYNLASRYVAILFKSSTSVFKEQRKTALKPPAGGGSRIRTGDILLAKQALYQLSYAPLSSE